MHIGPFALTNRLMVAPMAGVTDRPFRQLCKQWGAGYAVSEMITSRRDLWHTAKTTRRADHRGESGPIAVQIAGTDPHMMADAARHNIDNGAQIIDINMGCPVPKIMKTGAGASLLADPDRAVAVIRAMADAVRIPVTVKMRRGLKPGDCDPADLARRFEDAGAAMITIHPRAAAEEYSGSADHQISAEVVRAVQVPVVISGDIADAAGAREALERTGAAGVMIGRAALGIPWVFRAIGEGAADPRPPLYEVIDELVGFSNDIVGVLGADNACHYLRKFHSWYLVGRGVPDDQLQALMEDPTLDVALDRLARLREAAILAA